MSAYFKILGFLIPLVFPLSLLGQVPNTWVVKADFAMKRERAVSFSIGSLGYVSCGQSPGDSLSPDVISNDLWAYSPASNSWSQKADLPGSVRRNAVAFSINNIGYVGTGMDSLSSSDGSNLNDFWAYDPSLNSWSSKANYPGAGGNGVYFATAFSLNGLGYICGGKVGPSNYVFDLWSYDPSSDQWTQKTDFPGGLRYKLGSFTSNGKGYVGLGIDLDVYRKDIWEFDPTTNSWQQMNDFAGGEIGAVSTFMIGNQAFICTGEDGSLSDELYEYDYVGDTWHIRANLPGSERRYAIAFTIANRGYVGLGDGPNGKKKNFYEYTPGAPVNVEQIEFESSIMLYPNPCKNFLIVNSEESVINETIIYDSNGRKVLSSNETYIDVSGLAPGHYNSLIKSVSGLQVTKQLIKL